MRLYPRSRRRRDPAGSMTVVEHLEELRKRLTISIAAIGVGAIAGWVLYPQVFHLLIHSYRQACEALPTHNKPPIPCDTLVAQSVLEPFIVRLKVSVFTGFGIALPVVLYELWRFVTPGLTRSERRLAIPFVLSSLMLFSLGALFAYLTLPKGLHFLLGFAGQSLVVLPSATKYFSFVMLLVLAFGISFEFPLLLIFLAWVRVVPSTRLRQWRRYAILTITIFAAVITPSQDPYTQLAMMVPMILFYELAIVVARLLKR
jgi:sec-independent protein translocase protein TatC